MKLALACLLLIAGLWVLLKKLVECRVDSEQNVLVLLAAVL